MDLSSVSKKVRRVCLASLILLICAIASCYVGQRQWEREVQESERRMEASGFFISDFSPETNIWQIVGALILLAGIAVAIAAFMLWRQDRQA